MFPQIVYAQYGSHRSFYGNIQLGAAPEIFQVYGAWPQEKPAQQGMLVSDWQEPVIEELSLNEPTQELYAEEIASRIDVIRQLKAQIAIENDLKAKNILQEKMSLERQAKERAFQLKARIYEEESTFMLLH